MSLLGSGPRVERPVAAIACRVIQAIAISTARTFATGLLMEYLTLRNTTRATVLGTRVALADTLTSRLRGLSCQVLEPGEGLLLTPCRVVHTFGVKTPLDLVFLDRKGTVVGLQECVPPQRVSSWKIQAVSVLKLPPGTIRSSHTREGDRLSWSRTAHGSHTTRTPEHGHERGREVS